MANEVQQPTVHQYFDAVEFEHPDDPGYKCYASHFGVQVGDHIVAMVNGTMSIFPADGPPDAINHDAYMADWLDANGAQCAGTPRTMVFDPTTLRYVHELPGCENGTLRSE